MDDTEFVRELYDASYRRLVGQLVGVTGSAAEAEDVVQEAFVRGIGHARTLRRADNPEAWLRTVAVNLARSRWRRMQRFAGLMPRLTADEPDPGDLAGRVALLAALRRLPAAQREAIALHHLADLPVHEVAATLGVPTGTVKARLARGRAALAVLLSEPEPTPSTSPSTSTEEVHRG
ncbi:MAG: RNA polymerase sigma factor [Nocardioidaceae bacterium]